MALLTASLPATIERPDAVDKPLERHAPGWVVTVFDNDYNTYDEVVFILIAATGCTMDEAAIETWEIDHLGKSNVHFGGREECETAATVIAQIGIDVEVREE